jgi:hypothetical protein
MTTAKMNVGMMNLKNIEYLVIVMIYNYAIY